MNKTLVRILLAALPAAAALSLPAATESVAGVSWSFEAAVGTASSGVCVTGADPAAGGLVVPETLGGLPVKAIGARAFWNASGVTALSVPGSVEEIGDHAFEGCAGLAKLELADGLARIGQSAFRGCADLVDLTVPGSVREIGVCAFTDCTALKAARLGEGVAIIRADAFDGCRSLTLVALPRSLVTVEPGAFGSSVPVPIGVILTDPGEGPRVSALLEEAGCPLSKETVIVNALVVASAGDVSVDPDGTVRVTLSSVPSGVLEVADNLGPVTLDLNGTDLAGATGYAGDALTNPGRVGSPAIRVFASGATGDPTVLSIVNSAAGPVSVTGGDGGPGTPGGDGAAAIEVASGVKAGVIVNVGAGVSVTGGSGGPDLSGIARAGRAGVAVKGTVGEVGGELADGEGSTGLKRGICCFQETEVGTNENASVKVRVFGGSVDRSTSVKLYLKHGPTSSSDIDVNKTVVAGKTAKKVTFPVSLSWAKGELGTKIVTFKLKKDSLLEGTESFTLQLGGELGLDLQDARTCTVTVGDRTTANPLKVSVKNPKKTKGVTKFAVAVTNLDETAGHVIGSGMWYKGAKLTVKAQAKTGWAFAGWYDVETDAKVSSAANYTFTVSTNRSLEARFDRRHYLRVLADPVDGGTVTGGGWLATNSVPTVKATAKSHFKFLGWFASKEGNPNEADPEAMLSDSASWQPTVAEGGATVWARFSSEPRLEVLKPSGGTVSGTGKFAEGKTATLKAVKKSGYTFTGWYDEFGNLLSLATTYKYVMGPSDTVLTAAFTKESKIAAPVLDWNAPTNLVAGVSYTAKPTAHGETLFKVVSMSGLPKGLSFKSGKVSGGATTAKTNTVSVKVALASNSKKTWTVKQKLVVEPLPDWVKGSYIGGGFEKPVQASLSVATTGKVSGKLNFANAVWTLSGTRLSKLDRDAKTATLSLTAAKGKTKKTVSVSFGADELGGWAASATTNFVFEARQNLWKTDAAWQSAAELLNGRNYEFEDGDLVMKFTTAGRANGVLFTATRSFTGSATLCPVEIAEGSVKGAIFFYFAPDTKKKFKGAVKAVEISTAGVVEP